MGGNRSPIVKRRLGIRQINRLGRGFSLKELEEAGLSVDEARKLGLYVDLRRKTSHPENVQALKEIISRWKPSG